MDGSRRSPSSNDNIRQQTTVVNLNPSEDHRKKRHKKSPEYLTAHGHVQVSPTRNESEKTRVPESSAKVTAQDHVQVDAVRLGSKKRHRERSEDKLSSSNYRNVDVVPLNSNDLVRQKTIEKEDYLTAHGHVHVDHSRPSLIEEKSTKQVDVVRVSRPSMPPAPHRTDEHFLIEFIDDSQPPIELSGVEYSDDDFTESTVSIVSIDDDDIYRVSKNKQKYEFISPPDHTDIHLVPRDSSDINRHQFVQRQERKNNYLTAKGHVQVGRSKTEAKHLPRSTSFSDTENVHHQQPKKNKHQRNHRRINIHVPAAMESSDSTPSSNRRPIHDEYFVFHDPHGFQQIPIHIKGHGYSRTRVAAVSRSRRTDQPRRSIRKHQKISPIEIHDIEPAVISEFPTGVPKANVEISPVSFS